MQSYATIVHNSRSSRPHCIVSVNYVLSDAEVRELVLSNEQLPRSEESLTNSTSGTTRSTAGIGGNCVNSKTEIGKNSPGSPFRGQTTTETLDSEYADSSGYVSSDFMPNHNYVHTYPPMANPNGAPVSAQEDNNFYQSANELFYSYNGQ